MGVPCDGNCGPSSRDAGGKFLENKATNGKSNVHLGL